MALQAIRGEVVAADTFSASFYAHITADSKRSRKEAAPANDENADAANANTYTPHTPGKVCAHVSRLIEHAPLSSDPLRLPGGCVICAPSNDARVAACRCAASSRA